MRLGDLLVQAKKVTAEQIEHALELQTQSGGRLGDNLVAIGAITADALEAFLHRIPTEPVDTAATKIDPTELLSLLMKLIYVGHLGTVRQFVDAIKLPYHVVLELVGMAVDRQLLHTLGARNSASPLDMSYALTDAGQR